MVFHSISGDPPTHRLTRCTDRAAGESDPHRHRKHCLGRLAKPPHHPHWYVEIRSRLSDRRRVIQLVFGRSRPRSAYHALRREHSGFVLKQARLQGGVLSVEMVLQSEFPLFPPGRCELKVRFVDRQNRPLSEVRVALETDKTMKILAPTGAGGFHLEVWRGDFCAAKFSQALAP